MDNKIERKYPNPEDFKTEDEWFDACMKLRSQPERDPDKFKKMFEESSLFKSKKPEREETQEERYDGFKVTIDDGFVAYEYKFPKGEHLSIHQIAEAISDQTGLEIESSIQVNP